jgi:hypothetical protein
VLARRGLKRSGEEGTAGGGRSAQRVVLGRSVAGGVRSICPFCGNSEQTGGAPCCEEWVQTTSVEAYVVADRHLGLTAALPGAAAIQRRLGAASQSLVALLASSIIAMGVSLGTQRRLADDATWKEAIVVGSRILYPRQESESTASVATEPLPPVPPEPQGPASIVAPPSAVAAAIPPAALAPAPKDMSSKTAAVAPAAVAPPRRPAVPQAVRPEPKALPIEVASIRAPSLPTEEEAPRPVVAEPLPADSEIARRAEQEAAEMGKAEIPPAAVRATQPPSPWRQLRRGMTQGQVLALLGQPKWKRHLVTTEWWLYKENSLYGTGRIGFSAEEGLISWREP